LRFTSDAQPNDNRAMIDRLGQRFIAKAAVSGMEELAFHHGHVTVSGGGFPFGEVLIDDSQLGFLVTSAS
jgi:hypothetical protein